MLVREVMSQRPITVTPDVSAKEALVLLDRHSITSMPVIDASGTLVGVVGEADLVREALPNDPRTHMMPVFDERHHQTQRVGDVMTRHPITVPADIDLAEATEVILSAGVKSVPVVDGSRPVGMVSRRDVVHTLARSDADITGQLDELYRSFGVDWSVDVHDGDVTVEGPVGAKARSLAETAAGTVQESCPSRSRRSAQRGALHDGGYGNGDGYHDRWQDERLGRPRRLDHAGSGGARPRGSHRRDRQHPPPASRHSPHAPPRRTAEQRTTGSR